MRTAAQVFYIAVFALLRTSHASSDTRSAVKAKETNPNVCAVSPRTPPHLRLRHRTHRTFAQYEPNTIVSDACASYSTLDDLNEAIHPQVHAVTQDSDFFSHYRLNLYDKKCPFWSDEDGMCGNIACAVNTIDNEDNIPLAWRADALGALEGPKATHPGKKLQQERPAEKPLQGQLGDDVGESCVVEYDDECDERDYCVPEDESVTSKGDYVNLVDNPERFTGYSGPSANQVWETIYRENCFNKPLPPSEPSSASPVGFSNPLQAGAAMDLRNVIKSHGQRQGVQQAIARGSGKTPVDELDFDDECVEKRVFYRVISGMHASISTHLCWEYFDQKTGQWFPNATCYKERLHNYPERVSNLYFNYALLVRAVGKLRGHLPSYTFCSADPAQDRQTKALVESLSRAIGNGGEVFDESAMFKSADAVGLKEDFKFRFRNVSRIMDCVGCDKCRLWGKVQTNGYGAALKILFEFDEKDPSKDPPLRRTELVALFNTLDRVSHSLDAIKKFKGMLEGQEISDKSGSKVSPAKKEEELTSKINKTMDKEQDDGYPDLNRSNKPNMTVTEIFWEEWDLMWKTYKFVLRQWVSFPGKAWKIFLFELRRFYYSFVGLKAPPTNWGWELRAPVREEL
ncbi:endoplasmic oxidoreductin [Tothia fuscella]|uniref:Endoplasmic oxidoreductin n=1 Tax=Tothia fuscella TaxID=1048955 RepID=A0A9P4U1C5_9PEZI|nr:endoplasmic oxidoreductin [Tothia fuscella]